METESRNLDWTGILSVVERQHYNRAPGSVGEVDDVNVGTTDVTTTVQFRSRLGDRLRARARRDEEDLVKDVDEDQKKSLLVNWSTSKIQRSIESIARGRTSDQLGKSKQGMMIVLERLRSGGLIGVLDGMRQDREGIISPDGPWKRAWKNGERDGRQQHKKSD